MQPEIQSTTYSINIKGELYDLSRPKIMGIINCTPDSFYENSRVIDEKSILIRVEEMLKGGVDMVDIGGASTRPGSVLPTVKEEKERVLPAVQSIKKNFPNLILSLDTVHGEVAQIGIDHGIDIINDVTAGELDETILHVAAKNKTPYILTHSPGFVRSVLPFDTDSYMLDVTHFFSQKIAYCKSIGLNDLIIDPGFGFAKSIDQNFEIIRKFEMLKIFNRPILVGVSRKSMIYKTLGLSPEESLHGTIALQTILASKGANIIRVHDVSEMNDVRILLSSC
jgi:dihydropteroate synthase